MKALQTLILTVFLLCLPHGFLEAESLTMTTYYPAPYAGYAGILTTGGTAALGVNTLLVRNLGKVGIGTTAPRTKLSVMDTVVGLHTGLELSSYYRPGVAAGSAINAYDNGGAAVRSLVLQSNDGPVGIGPNLIPRASLHVVGTFKLQDGTQAAGRVLTSDAGGRASWAPPTTLPPCNNPGAPEASSNRPCLAPIYRCGHDISAWGRYFGSGSTLSCYDQLQPFPTCTVWNIDPGQGPIPAVQSYPCTLVGSYPFY
ncbi:MAG: hypothetical protein WCW52_06875 [Elusimicrobiales bacterium]